MNIKKDDSIIVIRGKYKGKTSKVLQSFPRTGKVLAEGVNIVKRATKPKKQGDKGGIIEKTVPIDRAKVKIICGKCKQPTRIGKKITTGGEKIRVCRKCGEEL